MSQIMMEVCLRCGRIGMGGFGTCDRCNGHNEVTTDVSWNTYSEMNSEQKRAWKSHIYETLVLPSPHFKRRLWDRRLRIEAEEAKNRSEELARRQATTDRAKAREEGKPIPEEKVHCPKCNSTQIQMVPRKWSLMTGFLTNKVDRVCVACKTKF